MNRVRLLAAALTAVLVILTPSGGASAGQTIVIDDHPLHDEGPGLTDRGPCPRGFALHGVIGSTSDHNGNGYVCVKTVP